MRTSAAFCLGVAMAAATVPAGDPPALKSLAPPGAADRRRPQPGPERRQGRGRARRSRSASSTRSPPRTCSSGKPSTPSRTATTSSPPTATSSSAAATGCSCGPRAACGTSRRRHGSSPARREAGRPRDAARPPAVPHRDGRGRYRGRIGGWDVVNEALEDDGTLRQTPWLEAIGEDYVAKAFEFAHEADPAAELYYNDYNLWKPAKRDAAVRLVQGAEGEGPARRRRSASRGTGASTDPPLAAIDAALGRSARRGSRPLVTELDVDVLPRDPDMWGADLSKKAKIRAATNVYPDGLPAAVQARLARRYADVFSLFLKHGVSRVTFWGVTDADTWLDDFPIPGRVNYPLLGPGRPREAGLRGRGRGAEDAGPSLIGAGSQ